MCRHAAGGHQATPPRVTRPRPHHVPRATVTRDGQYCVIHFQNILDQWVVL